MKTKTTPRWLKVLLVIFLILFLHTFFYRMSPFTTYIPFTGRLWSMNAGDMESIELRSIHLDYEECVITDPEALEELCDLLNSFRYSVILPEFLLPDYGGGDNHAIFTDGKTGKEEFITFSERYVIFRDIRFYPRNDALDELMEFVMEKAEFFKNNV